MTQERSCPHCGSEWDDSVRISRREVRCLGCRQPYVRWALVDAEYRANTIIGKDVDLDALKARLTAKGLKDVEAVAFIDGGNSRVLQVDCSYHVRNNTTRDIEKKLAEVLTALGQPTGFDRVHATYRTTPVIHKELL